MRTGWLRRVQGLTQAAIRLVTDMIEFPARLLAARTVGVYSPSGSFADTPWKVQLFEQGLARLRGYGFEIRESPHCRSSLFHMSASARDRASDLRELTSDRVTDIVLPSIGGHVAAQMLDYLDFDQLAASGAAIFGFSDNSTLPLITSSATGVVTFHTLCDVTFGFGRFSNDDFALTERNWLDTVRLQSVDLTGTQSWRTVTQGTTEGIVLGGNLRAILTLAGTRWWPDWRDVIFFWEAGDPLHAVQQDLTQLANCGVFDRVAGMVIGRASRLTEDFYSPDQIMPLDHFLLDTLGLRNRFPIVTEADIGHDVENVTIPLGARTRLTATGEAVEWTVL